MGGRLCVTKKEESTPYFKDLKELFIHTFTYWKKTHHRKNYKLQHLLVISVKPFANKWTNRNSEYQYLSLTLISEGRN